MNEHETVADFIAWLRRPREGENAYLTLWRAEIADRLEAAHKREEAEWKRLECDLLACIAEERQKPIGNCAKLREAIQKAAESAAEIMERVRHKDGLAFNTANYIAGVARTALAAPPRNCDMPLVVEGPADNNADKAWLAFRRHNPDAYFDVSGLLRCIDWLLAPATEGGAK
jgi:hypothetical protein